jgi:hypothetical protein
MTIYGYAGVSTDGQILASQDAQLHAAGCAKVYAEKVSGAKTERAELSGDDLITGCSFGRRRRTAQSRLAACSLFSCSSPGA